VDFEFTQRTPAGGLARYVESVWHARGQIPYVRDCVGVVTTPVGCRAVFGIDPGPLRGRVVEAG
jgi:hypothetical protein